MVMMMMIWLDLQLKKFQRVSISKIGFQFKFNSNFTLIETDNDIALERLPVSSFYERSFNHRDAVCGGKDQKFLDNLSEKFLFLRE